MRRRPLHGALLYAMAVAGILALLGRSSDAHPLALLRALVPALRARRLGVERFFASLAPRPSAAPSTGLADDLIRVERLRRPRGLTLPGEPDPEASRDASSLAATASAASFEDDVTPRSLEQDVDQGPAVAEGGVRFSRLLEFRTRQDLFLACRLRSQQQQQQQQQIGGGVKRCARKARNQRG